MQANERVAIVTKKSKEKDSMVLARYFMAQKQNKLSGGVYQMSKDNNSDFKKLVENPAIFETFIEEVKEGYSKKMNLVKAARIVTPETLSQKDFVVQILRALEANYSDHIVFLDILKAIVQNNGEKIKQIDTRLKKENRLQAIGIKSSRMSLKGLMTLKMQDFEASNYNE